MSFKDLVLTPFEENTSTEEVSVNGSSLRSKHPAVAFREKRVQSEREKPTEILNYRKKDAFGPYQAQDYREPAKGYYVQPGGLVRPPREPGLLHHAVAYSFKGLWYSALGLLWLSGRILDWSVVAFWFTLSAVRDIYAGARPLFRSLVRQRHDALPLVIGAVAIFLIGFGFGQRSHSSPEKDVSAMESAHPKAATRAAIRTAKVSPLVSAAKGVLAPRAMLAPSAAKKNTFASTSTVTHRHPAKRVNHVSKKPHKALRKPASVSGPSKIKWRLNF